MKYSAGMVSQLFWFNETKETVKYLNSGMSKSDFLKKVVEENLFQLKAEDRRKRACNCIYRRLDSLPDELTKRIDTMDTSSAKIVVLISIMKSDLLFFEFVYEVYRQKIILGEKKIEDKDLNLFFDYKYEQSDIVQKWSDSAIKKLKNCYVKMLCEAGLVNVNKKSREIVPALINYRIEEQLKEYNLDIYLKAVKGEQ